MNEALSWMLNMSGFVYGVCCSGGGGESLWPTMADRGGLRTSDGKNCYFSGTVTDCSCDTTVTVTNSSYFLSLFFDQPRSDLLFQTLYWELQQHETFMY
ncbi:hypothetical protein Zmor_017980 [Zophobas morio]|uniref:Uncharacterized protein n=1 Tax=Zophobas morio TaxID=2755281 RepID=A0AA38IAP9_9CUCU|nr:hypothetical protein Zmor_017980 [Zophobas morio]